MSLASYTSFFWNSPSSVVALETLEISHPSFSKTYWIVRNAMAGITAKIEDGTTQTFTYYPLSIKPTGAQDDLDQTMQIQLGDLGEVIPQEIDNVMAGGTMQIKPTLIYRVYRSDDLTQVMDGPFRYEITAIGTKKSNSAFTAMAPKLNTSRTGEVYELNRFPMLAGFL